jgi:hypothetical protein
VSTKEKKNSLISSLTNSKISKKTTQILNKKSSLPLLKSEIPISMKSNHIPKTPQNKFIKHEKSLSNVNNKNRRLSMLMFSGSTPSVKPHLNSSEKIGKIKDDFTLNNNVNVVRKNERRNSKRNGLINGNILKKKINTSKTLNLIGKNIQNSSMALNNPKMFYQNYFSKVVIKADQNEEKNNLSYRLKKIGELIQTKNESKKNNHNEIKEEINESEINSNISKNNNNNNIKEFKLTDNS